MKFKLGDCELYFLRDGAFWLDGGGFFGIVPKVLWQKIVTPDELNRVKLNINPLLVKTPKNLVLIDPGLGDKWSEKRRSMYGIERIPSLRGTLQEAGFTTGDIDTVVATHLHFDHVGACTERIDGAEAAVPVFENARHYIQKEEWIDASNPDERTKAAYVTDDFAPLDHAKLVSFLDGSSSVVPHVRVEITGGHTRSHQIVLIESEGEVAAYFGGILPAISHLQIAYTMGFDLYPVEVMRRRRQLYERAMEDNWLVCLEHDCEVRAGRIGWKYTFTPVVAERRS